MQTMAQHKPQWAPRPSNEELESAVRYLALQFRSATAKRLVARARRGRRTEHTAKDILRATCLPLLPVDEPHVAQDLKRIRKGKAMSPIILIQGDLTRGRPLVIADGYHRMCAACHADEDAPIAAVMVSI